MRLAEKWYLLAVTATDGNCSTTFGRTFKYLSLLQPWYVFSVGETYVQNSAQKNIGERYSYSGQCLIPPLQCWCGERQVWDQAMTVGVEDGGTNYLGETAVRLVFMQLLNLVHLFPNR